jgi:enoyl-CoA hydratase
MSEFVVRSDSEAVTTLILNRPEKRNAINEEVFRGLRAHIKEIHNDSTVGLVVIRGTGGHFCAGHDLVASPRPDPVGWIRHELHTLELLTKLRQPVIAAVEGSCFTGGLELALAGDFIVCDETARFADTHAKWGLVPGWGMSQRLPRRVGQARALELMMTSRIVEGREAASINLANACTDAGALDGLLDDFARMILANSWHSNAENKRLVYNTDGMRLSEGLDHELMRNAGLDRDAAKRRSAFTGRSRPAAPGASG